MKKFLVFILLFSSCLHSSGGNRFYKGFDPAKVKARDPRIAQAIELQGKIAAAQSGVDKCNDTLAIIRRMQSENEAKEQVSYEILPDSSKKMTAMNEKRTKQEVLMRGGEKYAETDQERRRFAQQRRINQNIINMNNSALAIEFFVNNRFWRESERALFWEKSDLEAERLKQLRQKMNDEQELKTLLNGTTVVGLIAGAMNAVKEDEIRESKQKKSAVFDQMKLQHKQKELAKNRASHQEVVAEIKQREVVRQQLATAQRQAEEAAAVAAKKKAARTRQREKERARKIASLAAKEKEKAREDKKFEAALKESACKDKSTVDSKLQGAAAEELDEQLEGRVAKKIEEKSRMDYFKSLPKTMSMAARKAAMNEYDRIQEHERLIEENRARKDYAQGADKEVVKVEFQSLVVNSMRAVSSVLVSTTRNNILGLNSLCRAFKDVKKGLCCHGVGLSQYPGVAALQASVETGLMTVDDRIEKEIQVKESKQIKTILQAFQGVVGAPFSPPSDQNYEMLRANIQADVDKNSRTQESGEILCDDILRTSTLFAKDHNLLDRFRKEAIGNAILVAAGSVPMQELVDLQQRNSDIYKDNPMMLSTLEVMNKMQMIIIDVLQQDHEKNKNKK